MRDKIVVAADVVIRREAGFRRERVAGRSICVTIFGKTAVGTGFRVHVLGSVVISGSRGGRLGRGERGHSPQGTGLFRKTGFPLRSRRLCGK